MPHIIPIKELKNTAKISEMCHSVGEPIFITKNGCVDMVLMSMETYERIMQQIDNAVRYRMENQCNPGEALDLLDEIGR